MLNIGDRVTISIGKYRGGPPKESIGFIPGDSLKDGTLCTISSHSSYGWYAIKECPHKYVYHSSTLLTTKQKLHEAVKDFK